MLSDPAGDIIIPAHNEQAVIGRCLEALDPDSLGPQVRTIVACNGCTDATADIARRHGVAVLEIGTASKPAAIRAAEAQCRKVPRIYLDADVELESASARAILTHLAQGSLAARPTIDYVTDDCGWSVRHYYRARRGIPSVMNRLWGAGVYGLSPAGRARFGEYPDVTAEDFWVDLHFADTEITILDDCPAVRVYVPRTGADLRAVLRRVYQGPVQARPAEVKATADTTGHELARYARSGPGPLLDALVYAAFALGSRVPTPGTRGTWQRDDSTRGSR
jgi:glycosyltransferase involved in cell wall biosynthesis